MAVARRMKEKEKNGLSKLSKFFIILFILILVNCIIFFFLIKTNKIAFLSGFFDNLKFNIAEKPTASEELKDSKLKIEKSIKGLDKIKVLNIDINNSESISIITISLENTLDKKVESKKCRLNLLDENNNSIFSSSIKMPEIDANTKKDFKIICSDNITNIYDYEVKLETK